MTNEALGVEAGGWVRWLRDGFGLADVRIRFEPNDSGRLVAREVRIVNEGGIPAEALREIPLGRLERWVNRDDVAAAVRGDEQVERLERQRISARVAVPKRRGRAPYPPSFYRRVAKVSTEHSAKAIAEASGVPTTTVTRWIKGAREQGYLTQARTASGVAKP